MTIIEQIKAEIERLKGIGGIVPLDNREQKTGYESALIDVETFLDTLESEKPMNPEAAMKELDEKIALVKQRGTWDDVDVDKYMDEVRGREPEKPMNLEEEIKRFVAEYGYERSEDILLIAIVARQFYELGCRRTAEKFDEIEYNRQRAEESVPNDLEEAAEEYLDKLFGKGRHQPFYKELFIAGAKWQADHTPLPEDTVLFNKGVEEGKRLMMEEAVEGTVIKTDKHTSVRYKSFYGTDRYFYGIADKQFKPGDKVLIIIVKE